MRRSVATLGTCGLLVARLIGGGASAQAQSPVPCALTVTDGSSPAGSVGIVVGDNFPTTPRTVPIILSGNRQLALVTVNDAGHFTIPVRIPLDLEDGFHTLSAACGTGGEATSQIDILAAQSATPHRVSDDNVDGAGLMVAGVLAVGVGLALTARRRRTQRVVS